MKQEIRERIEKIRKGEVPEGYRKTKVGIIPGDWDVKKFGRLAKFKNGLNFIKNNGKEIVKIIGVSGFQKNITPQNNSFENIIIDRKLNDDELLKKEDLLFVRSNGNRKLIGRCLYINKIISSTSFSGFTIRARIKSNEIEALYCAYLFHFYPIKKQIFILGGGTNISNLSQEILSEINIQFPQEINERNIIINILSNWDKAIELNETLIEEKKKLRSAIVNDLLFGLKRFDEFIKSHQYKHTKYIRIPEDWEYIKIGEIATEVSEKNGDNDDLPVLSCTKYEGLVDSLSYFKRQVFSEDISTYKQVKKNHFVYATNHIDEGSIGCQNLYENALVSPMYTVFKTNSKVNNHFLFNLLKTRLYIFIYQVNMSASVDRRGSLRWNEFSEIRIPLPDITEQDKIVEFIRLFDNNIELLKSELIHLKEQKKGLMQLLLTGIVRVEVD
ncbi:MAG: type I restriction-modification system specificity subunit [Candidatus Methanoperedens nitroreducens]|uniref:Type I restriction-modification system specificity subunit n=1 Tax=Candidatus Methanoperedens nitratireducens TaxID=1392998 RepID=A0A0P7ZF03_9EURY|nr:restriction endonuclease subunit S [Candidatus Methanoperedens sp. BLZ2]KAB2945094.1 MAG: restriction endonuclease subunit S [Candidatus Methanoperedens sp.]KPQ42091.1 MAG: type I restriction-modification system specificity subunit [Candidatus Methanoperedens sp. BLZ1]MBZ0177010.1 restriction endonuclease subunit S [Candidatus Methanoperedens nitroreducens]MCX9078190.1 restriction endonuclease subunit S [Candidatus Methanoperedens sp.]